MKLIFLDIDGVLNSASGRGPYESDMEVEKLFLLSKLIKDSNSDGVVITSDRRYSSVDMKDKYKTFSKYNIKVIGLLRNPNDDLEDNRGKQIMDFLINSKDEITHMLILDDNDEGISNLFNDVFIKVNRFYGLSQSDYVQGIHLLSNQY